MSRNLVIELPFTSDPLALATRVRQRAEAAGAKLDFADDGLGGTFMVRKMLLTLVKGAFVLQPDSDGGGVARVHVTDAAGFITDDQIRDQLTRVFSELAD